MSVDTRFLLDPVPLVEPGAPPPPRRKWSNYVANAFRARDARAL